LISSVLVYQLFAEVNVGDSSFNTAVATMTSHFERRHVSRMIPADHKILMPLLLAVTIVNSAVGYSHVRANG